MRAPFQVLVIGFRETPEFAVEYLILRRRDQGIWQAIAGGGEDEELAAEAARREAFEEAGITRARPLYRLATVNSIPVADFAARESWSPDLYVIPEYSFGIDCGDDCIVLSHEHTEYRWLAYEAARERLHWQGNRVALWELAERISTRDLTPL